MDNMNRNNSQSVDKLQNGFKKKNTMYDVVKKRYDEFTTKMEKPDLKNGYTRYLTELSILKKLLEYARQYASKQEIQDVSYQIERVNEILKEQFGITVK